MLEKTATNTRRSNKSVIEEINPGQNNPGYICVASTHNIPHARARHCDGGTPSRNRYFNLSML